MSGLSAANVGVANTAAPKLNRLPMAVMVAWVFFIGCSPNQVFVNKNRIVGNETVRARCLFHAR
jgi:hypothetical protein